MKIEDVTNTDRHWTRWAMLLVAGGIILRIARYLSDRSLWLDEVLLARNLLDRTFGELLGRLDYLQAAPPGFLMLCKVSVSVFGRSEYALRLVPLLAGIASVLLFAAVARRMFQPAAALLALALFTLVEPLIYFSSEVKQYSCDVAVGLAILLMLLRWFEGPARARLVGLVVTCCAGMFLSHASLFVILTASILVIARSRKPETFLGVSVIFSMMALNYFLFLRPLAANMSLQQSWTAGFMPMSFDIFNWLGRSFLSIFTGFSTMWLDFRILRTVPAYACAVLAIVGILALRKTNRLHFWMLTGPILLALLASLLRKYPFADRLIHFIVPLAILLIAAGIDCLIAQSRRVQVVTVALCALIVIPSISRTAIFLVAPPGREEIEPVLKYLSTRVQDGDEIYLYHAADAAYFYYRDAFGLTNLPHTHGRRPLEHPTAFADDAAVLDGKPRVWILFTHVWRDPADEEQQLLSDLRARGREREHFGAAGVDLYLFDLSTRSAD